MAKRRFISGIAFTALVAAGLISAGTFPGSVGRAAYASCITWSGGQNCDSSAPRATYHYQVPARAGNGIRYYGGQGGGSRAAAALSAAGAAISILGIMIDAAQQQHNANEEQRRTYNACQRRYRDAHAINEKARKFSANGENEKAYATFERALGTLGVCGSRSDLASLRRNLDNARNEYARLSTPSAVWSGDDRTNAPKRVTIFPGALEPAARELCNYVEENSPPWQACMASRKAEAIISADADIRDACQSVADVNARNQCAFNRYWAGVQGKDPNHFGDTVNCYWDEHGKPCHSGDGGAIANGSPSDQANEDPNSLRNRLRRVLMENAQNGRSNSRDDEIARQAEINRAKAVRDSLPEDSPDRKMLNDVIAKAEAGQMPTVAAAPAGVTPAQNPPSDGDSRPATADATPPISTDNAYQNYMNSSSANRGSQNNGDLSHPTFDMKGSDTRREINRLTGQ